MRGNIGWTQVAMLLGAFTYADMRSGIGCSIPKSCPSRWQSAAPRFVLLPLTALLWRGDEAVGGNDLLVYCVIPGCVLPSIYLVLP